MLKELAVFTDSNSAEATVFLARCSTASSLPSAAAQWTPRDPNWSISKPAQFDVFFCFFLSVSTMPKFLHRRNDAVVYWQIFSSEASKNSSINQCNEGLWLVSLPVIWSKSVQKGIEKNSHSLLAIQIDLNMVGATLLHCHSSDSLISVFFWAQKPDTDWSEGRACEGRVIKKRSSVEKHSWWGISWLRNGDVPDNPLGNPESVRHRARILLEGESWVGLGRGWRLQNVQLILVKSHSLRFSKSSWPEMALSLNPLGNPESTRHSQTDPGFWQR